MGQDSNPAVLYRGSKPRASSLISSACRLALGLRRGLSGLPSCYSGQTIRGRIGILPHENARPALAFARCNADNGPTRSPTAYNTQGVQNATFSPAKKPLSNRASTVDTQYIGQISDFFLNFTPASCTRPCPGSCSAPCSPALCRLFRRRAPAVMLPLSTVLLSMVVASKLGYPLHWTLALIVVSGSIVLGLVLFFQPVVDHSMAFLGRHRFLTIGLSGLLGLVIPMCECGIIPLTRRLLRKGLPLSCCVTYILSGPIINIVVLLTTFVAFSNKEKEGGMIGDISTTGRDGRTVDGR